MAAPRPRPLMRDPVYQQLNQRLRDLMRGGEFTTGRQFLTERQVAERFGVSRPTANKALASLVTEGLLEFRKGVGTFVRSGVLDYDLRRLVSFTEQAKIQGKLPKTEVLAFRKVAGDEVEAAARDALQLGEKGAAYYTERLRLADDQPVIFERRYISAALCPRLTKGDLADSLYSVWIERFHLAIAGADETIRAVNQSPRQAEILKNPPGAAGMLVVSTGFLEDDQPLWWEETLYRADAYEFRNRLGGLTAPVGRRLQTPSASDNGAAPAVP